MWWLNLAIQNFYFARRQSPPSALHWNLNGPFLFFVARNFNPILSVLSAAGTAWLPEQPKRRRPWKCRHYWDTYILLEMFSHTLSTSLCWTPLTLCFIASLVWEQWIRKECERDVLKSHVPTVPKILTPGSYKTTWKWMGPCFVLVGTVKYGRHESSPKV